MNQLNYIFEAAKEGINKIVNLIHSNGDIAVESSHVSSAKEEDLITTALMIAARKSDYNAVKILLEKHNVDHEVINMFRIRVRDPLYKDSSALGCAAYQGHLEMVKMLMEDLKVNTDHPTGINASPTRPACFNIWRKCLASEESGSSSITAPTCLMMASGRGHTEVRYDIF